MNCSACLDAGFAVETLCPKHAQEFDVGMCKHSLKSDFHKLCRLIGAEEAVAFLKSILD